MSTLEQYTGLDEIRDRLETVEVHRRELLLSRADLGRLAAERAAGVAAEVDEPADGQRRPGVLLVERGPDHPPHQPPERARRHQRDDVDRSKTILVFRFAQVSLPAEPAPVNDGT